VYFLNIVGGIHCKITPAKKGTVEVFEKLCITCQ
jgi:hypothetical protein